jgi:hypothetical protein
MSGKPEPKTTVREWLIRGVAALVGAALAIGVNVASEQINSSIEDSKDTSTACPAVARGTPVGHQGMEVWLSPVRELCWGPSLDALGPGDEFDVQLHFFNATGEKVENVVVQALLPDGFELVGGSSRLKNTSYPDGKIISDGVLDPGINVGHYSNSGGAWLMFTVRVASDFRVSCDQITVYPISARLPYAGGADNSWVSASVVSNGNC